MFRRAHAAVAVSLTSFAFGQATPPSPSPDAPPVELLKNSSFEEPAVQGRVSATEGGNPTKVDETKTSWAHFQVFRKDKEGEGKFTVGLTNEFARTGKQCLFVDYNKVTAMDRRSFLMSELIPIKPANKYRVSIWGRTDKKRPLTLDQRLTLLRVEAEYFTPDMESQAGDIDFRAMLVPGNTKRIFFVSNQWNEYKTDFRTPRGAGWMKITFRWETMRDEGATDGAIYFDDASVTLVPGGESLIPLDDSDVIKPDPGEVEMEDDAEEAKPAPASPTPIPATPAPPAKKP